MNEQLNSNIGSDYLKKNKTDTWHKKGMHKRDYIEN